MGVSENSVPLNPMVHDHYPVFKWLFHWECSLFSDKPIYLIPIIFHQSPSELSPLLGRPRGQQLVQFLHVAQPCGRILRGTWKKKPGNSPEKWEANQEKWWIHGECTQKYDNIFNIMIIIYVGMTSISCIQKYGKETDL